MDWFKGKLADLARENRKVRNTPGTSKLPSQMNQSFMSKVINVRSTGRMVMFAYDAKHKDKLPYWDALPLILVVEMKPDGFTGLNLHYVPPLVRKSIIQALMENLNWEPTTATGLSKGQKKSIAMSYNILKGSARYQVIKPCFKRYLFSQVKSTFMYIDPREWEKAIMMPTERFQKASKTKVHRDSVGGGLTKAVPSLKPVSEKAVKPTTPTRNTNFFGD